tara:strand:+ start:1566 stop:2255 length:690 start_codon:yes stop_codon:yes gene_type:complete
MKISEDTINILDNFSSVHGSIIIKPGSDILTISAGKNIIAKATVDETFPKDFGIYELGQFLGAISLLEDPEFEFDSDYVDVSSGRRKIRYGYTDPTLIKGLPNNQIPDSLVALDAFDLVFELTQDNLKAIRKAAGVLNLPHVSFQTNPFVANVSDKAKSSSNSFDIDLKADNVEFEADFTATFIVDNLKLFPGDYEVKISSQGIGRFAHKEIDLEYWIASESSYSTVSN